MARWLIFAVLVVAGCAGQVKEVEPTVVQLNAPSLDIAAKSVKLALSGRKWQVDSERPGLIEAKLVHEATSTTVRSSIAFDKDRATISYIDGATVRMKEDRLGKSKQITEQPDRGDYQRWIDNLAKDMPVHVRRLAIIDG